MRAFVIDASALAKLVLNEAGSDQVADAVNTAERIYAPSLLVAEIANIAWRHALAAADHLQRISLLEDFNRLFGLIIIEDNAKLLYKRALDIGLALHHPIYDCFYLAHAESVGLPLLTADARLVRTCQDTPWKSQIVCII